MKKIILFIILLVLIHPLAFAKLKIVTTTTDLAALAKEVGGNLVEVKSLIRGSQDPHYIEPKPSYATMMNKADLFVAMGLSLEVGWVPTLLPQSRNPKIQRGHKGFIEPYQGLKILEIPTGEIDRSGGDIHPEGNPHYLLDPRNGIFVAKNLANKIANLDPANNATYQKNYKRFAKDMRGKIAAWNKKLARFKDTKVITHHKTFTYFANWLGLEIVDRIESRPGIPPSPKHMVDLIKLIKKQNIPFILLENYYNQKPAKKLAKETNIKILNLPVAVNGVNTVTSYAGLFDYLVSKLQRSNNE